MCLRIIGACFICVFLAACDGQEQTEVINKTAEVISKTTEVKTAPEKSTQQKPRPALNLSIDDITLDQENNDDIFNTDKEPTKTNSDTFETLSREQRESDISLSGKVFTDEEKLENKEYLDSIDGLQINIEGNFQ